MTRTVNLTAEIPANRELRIVLPPDVPAGPANIVLEVSPTEETVSPPIGSSIASLARSEFFGMWRNRTDIVDSVEFAANLRSQGWQRSRE